MSIDRINAQDILELLPFVGEHKIEVHDSLVSTNDYLLEQLNTGVSHANIVLSERQTAGKGRQGNTWNSPPGNIYLSLHRVFNCELKELYGLSLVVGIAVARVLKSNGLHDVQLKWPNDIYWMRKKLGGILVETRRNGTFVDAVIGIGLNVRDATDVKFVCLEDALQHRVYRNKIIAQLIVSLDDIMCEFARYGFGYFTGEWSDFAFNQTVKY